EHELGSHERERQYPVDLVADPGEEGLARGRLQHEQGEGELEADAPGHRLPPDRAAVGGQGVGDAHDDDQADERERTLHTGDGAYVRGRSASREPIETWAQQIALHGRLRHPARSWLIPGPTLRKRARAIRAVPSWHPRRTSRTSLTVTGSARTRASST